VSIEVLERNSELTPEKHSGGFSVQPSKPAQSSPCAQRWCRAPGTPMEQKAGVDWEAHEPHADSYSDGVLSQGPFPTGLTGPNLL